MGDSPVVRVSLPSDVFAGVFIGTYVMDLCCLRLFNGLKANSVHMCGAHATCECVFSRRAAGRGPGGRAAAGATAGAPGRGSGDRGRGNGGSGDRGRGKREAASGDRGRGKRGPRPGSGRSCHRGALCQVQRNRRVRRESVNAARRPYRTSYSTRLRLTLADWRSV